MEWLAINIDSISAIKDIILSLAVQLRWGFIVTIKTFFQKHDVTDLILPI